VLPRADFFKGGRMAVGVVPQKKSHDDSLLREFLTRIRRCWETKPEYLDKCLPIETIERLAGLAGISNNELFDIGIKLAWLQVFIEKNSKTVYAGQVTRRLNDVRKSAELLARQIDELLQNKDAVTSSAIKVLCDFLDKEELFGEEDPTGEKTLAEFGHTVHLLANNIRLAEIFAPRIVSAARGRPSGTGSSGLAMRNFITRLEYVALASGGSWTLDKVRNAGAKPSADRQTAFRWCFNLSHCFHG
jgi:hypothetical protein